MMLKLLIICTSLCAVLWPASLIADYKKIKSFSEVDTKHLTTKSLVVTDINDTLVTCSEALWQKASMKALPKHLTEKLKHLTEQGKNYLANLILTKCHNRELGESV